MKYVRVRMNDGNELIGQVVEERENYIECIDDNNMFFDVTISDQPFTDEDEG